MAVQNESEQRLRMNGFDARRCSADVCVARMCWGDGGTRRVQRKTVDEGRRGGRREEA